MYCHVLSVLLTGPKKKKKKKKENIASLCSFCNTDEESILHPFYHCPFSKSFWSEVTVLIYFCCKKNYRNDRIYHFHSKDSNLEHTVLLLCLLGKFHLHKARTNVTSNFFLAEQNLSLLDGHFGHLSKNILYTRPVQRTQKVCNF